MVVALDGFNVFKGAQRVRMPGDVDHDASVGPFVIIPVAPIRENLAPLTPMEPNRAAMGALWSSDREVPDEPNPKRLAFVANLDRANEFLRLLECDRGALK